MSEEKTFGTTFNCMDGRCQTAVWEYMQATFGVDYVDAITEPGMDGILAGKIIDPSQPSGLADWIRFKAGVSANGHGSRHAVLVGHAHCAGNAVSDETHIVDIRRAVQTIKLWNLFQTVSGLMVEEGPAGWQVHPVDGDPNMVPAA